MGFPRIPQIPRIFYGGLCDCGSQQASDTRRTLKKHPCHPAICHLQMMSSAKTQLFSFENLSPHPLGKNSLFFKADCLGNSGPAISLSTGVSPGRFHPESRHPSRRNEESCCSGADSLKKPSI